MLFMKYFTSISILVLSLVIGYFIGVNSRDEISLLDENEPLYIKEYITDTIIEVREKNTYIPIVREEIIDTLLDTVEMNSYIEKHDDSIVSGDDLIISREEMLHSSRMTINYFMSTNHIIYTVLINISI